MAYNAFHKVTKVMKALLLLPCSVENPQEVIYAPSNLPETWKITKTSMQQLTVHGHQTNLWEGHHLQNSQQGRILSKGSGEESQS
jgi:hypothetical protein